jgi:ADP-heptose:LPS heptosyltransferase
LKQKENGTSASEESMSSGFVRKLFRTQKSAPFHLPGTLEGRSRVLAIDTGDLSDMLFHIPLLEGLRRKYAGMQIDFLLPEEHASLAAATGLARRCLVYEERQLKPLSPSYWALLRSVRRNSYQTVILMSLSPARPLELVAWISGAVLRMGPSHRHCYPAINFEVRVQGRQYPYRGSRPLCAAAFLGLDRENLVRRWPLPEEKLRRAQQLVHFNKPRKDELLVGVDPGLGKSGHGISLPNLHFLVKQLGSELPCRVLPLSDLGQRERCQEFEAQLASPLPGLPRDTLLDNLLLLCQCDLFVAANTDLFHFAVAQDVPTIGLFTRMDDDGWDPGPQPHLAILRVSKGERVDIETLMQAFESVVHRVGPTSPERFASVKAAPERP